MTKPTTDPWLIESDAFPFEFLSEVGERESWRKEIHRPIYHLHKWWAKRLGSIFRGILLGTQLDDGADLREAFYATHDFRGVTVLDPFMGSGTTIGEAHKLGLTALGRDINPVAVESVRVALGPMDREAIAVAYETLDAAVGKKIRDLYRTTDSDGKGSDVLYHFWVMEASCPKCAKSVDLFSSYVFAQNAYPKRKPEVRVVCPSCGDIFEGLHARTAEDCPSCDHHFDPQAGNAKASTATCPHCARSSTRSRRASSARIFVSTPNSSSATTAGRNTYERPRPTWPPTRRRRRNSSKKWRAEPSCSRT
jgi:putative DNA methylase